MESTIPAVKAFILERFLVGESPERLTNTTELVHSGILHSQATLQLVSFLEQRYGIELEAQDVGSSVLGTLESIDRMVQAKVAKKR
jgi:acyl carrier protein